MFERENDAKQLGSLIVRWRRNAGLSQSALAELLGTQQATVSKLESGKYKLTVTQLFCVLEACGLSLREVAAEMEATLGDEPKPIWERVDE